MTLHKGGAFPQTPLPFSLSRRDLLERMPPVDRFSRRPANEQRGDMDFEQTPTWVNNGAPPHPVKAQNVRGAKSRGAVSTAMPPLSDHSAHSWIAETFLAGFNVSGKALFEMRSILHSDAQIMPAVTLGQFQREVGAGLLRSRRT